MIPGNEPRSNRDLIADLEHTLQDGSSSDTALQVLGLLTRLVDIEGPNDDHLWWGHKVSHWQWDPAEVVDNGLDVVAHLRRDWEDWSSLSHGTVDELLDVLLLLDAAVDILDNDVDFVLNNDNLVEVHDLYGSEMLTCLGLRTWLISSDK